MKIMHFEQMGEEQLRALAETRTLDVRKLPTDELDKLAKRLVSAGNCDDTVMAYWEEVAGERRKREGRTANRKARRLESGGTWA